MNEDLHRAAKRALLSLDLTNLDDDCDEGAVQTLAARGVTAYGNVAALCVWPRFVGEAKRLVNSKGIRIATVVSFPGGDGDMGEVAEMTEKAVEDGADEIDMVIPWRALLEGNEEAVTAAVSRVKRAAGPAVPVKAILESGMLEKVEIIRRASELALEGEADFMKTSTGKVPVNATLRAVREMLEAIRDTGASAGVKPSGGIRSTNDAAGYLSLADEVMGDDWATPERFRLGASGVLDALVATLSGDKPAEVAEGY